MNNPLNYPYQVLEKARAKGVKLAEAYFSGSRSFSVEVSDGRIEGLKHSSEAGIGLRVLRGGRIGFAYTTDLSSSGLEDVVDRAIANAASTAPDENNALPLEPPEEVQLGIFDPRIGQVPLEEKIERGLALERAATGYDPRVKRVRKATYGDALHTIAIVNTHGVEGSYQCSYCGASLLVVAEDGEDSETGSAFQQKIRYDELDVENIGREAAAKAVGLLGAQPVTTGNRPVILAPEVGAEFLDIIAFSLSADSVQKRKSIFADALMERVASPGVTIVDDGRLEGGILSRPFDGEGVTTSRTPLIQDGVLMGYLHNTYTARRGNARSTGNGSRSFRSRPQVAPTNFYLEPGHTPVDELIKGTADAFYVVDVMGMHTANPVTGDFSVGASGYMLRSGERAGPVRGVAIAGNLVDMLKRVAWIGDDLRFFGGIGSPTFIIEELTVSGA